MHHKLCYGARHNVTQPLNDICLQATIGICDRINRVADKVVHETLDVIAETYVLARRRSIETSRWPLTGIPSIFRFVTSGRDTLRPTYFLS
jgi:hypothetical protein